MVDNRIIIHHVNLSVYKIILMTVIVIDNLMCLLLIKHSLMHFVCCLFTTIYIKFNYKIPQAFCYILSKKKKKKLSAIGFLTITNKS